MPINIFKAFSRPLSAPPLDSSETRITPARGPCSRGSQKTQEHRGCEPLGCITCLRLRLLKGKPEWILCFYLGRMRKGGGFGLDRTRLQYSTITILLCAAETQFAACNPASTPPAQELLPEDRRGVFSSSQPHKLHHGEFLKRNSLCKSGLEPPP
jgi:hypothetical protein